jgi:2-polyprenyl-6-methoxyphenol hydroxylase-like FAD-dependent oxidoreductase
MSLDTSKDGIEVPVLVVGAGPVGLVLATDLAWRGVGALTIDQGDGEVVFPATEAIFVRTMEHLRRLGIADPISHSPFPRDFPRHIVFVTRISGRQIAKFERDSAASAYAKAGVDSPEAAVYCTKKWFDPVIARHLQSQPGAALRYGWRLDSFRQDADGVRATVAVPAENRTVEVRARYLAACDGGRSAVRRQLGIEFEGEFAQGHNYSIYFRSRDFLRRQPHGLASQFLVLGGRHRYSVTAVDGSEEWRLSMYVQPDETDSLDPRRCLEEAFGGPLEAEILRAQPWAGHRVVARRYRDGRVFLAGDAAHMLWPKGGFGANTGIGDAADLAWKLEAALAGWGGEALIESYERERRPIGLRNVTEAASNRAADGELPSGPELEAAGPEGEAARARAKEIILRTRWKEFHTPGVQLGYRYADSPVIAYDGTPEPPDEPTRYVPSTWPGCRAPHAWIAPGRSTLDLFGRGFVLLKFPSAGDTYGLEIDAARAGVPLAVHAIDHPVIAALYEQPMVLVRPDGHVGWRGASVPQGLIDLLRGAATEKTATNTLQRRRSAS